MLHYLLKSHVSYPTEATGMEKDIGSQIMLLVGRMPKKNHDAALQIYKQADDYVIQAETEEEIMKQAVEHIWEHHAIKPEEITSDMK